MEAKQLQTFKTMRFFAVYWKLSAFYEGFSDKIDTELKVLRGHLSGTPNFSLAAVSIEKLNKSLQHQEITLRKYSVDTVSSLEDAMKQLQKIVFQDSELKGLTTQELIKLNQPVGDILVFINYTKPLRFTALHLTRKW